MTSDKELAANRANAQRSIGPTSDEGKATSSQNATTHGLTGKTVLLPGENPTEFELFCTAIVADLEPAGPLEAEFAQIVAHSQWRLKRVKRIEDGLLAYGQFGPTDPFSEPACFMDDEVLARSFMENRKSFNNLSQYESRIYRTMTDALKQIKGLQTSRNKFDGDVQDKANYLFHERWYTSGMPEPAVLRQSETTNGQDLSPQQPGRSTEVVAVEPPAVEVIPTAAIENLPDNPASETAEVCAPAAQAIGFVFPIDKFAKENRRFQPLRDEKTEAAPAQTSRPGPETELREVA
jgi:hypothetical protein